MSTSLETLSQGIFYFDGPELLRFETENSGGFSLILLYLAS